MHRYQAERIKAENRLGSITLFLLFGHICIMQRSTTQKTHELELETPHE